MNKKKTVLELAQEELEVINNTLEYNKKQLEFFRDNSAILGERKSVLSNFIKVYNTIKEVK